MENSGVLVRCVGDPERVTGTLFRRMETAGD